MSILVLLAATFFGVLAGAGTAGRFRPARSWPIAAIVLLAVIAAAAANATQRWLDLGLPFGAVDAIEAASYFVFGFSVTAAWRWLRPSRMRWFLAALVPVALFEPLRIGIALVAWALRRLGVW